MRALTFLHGGISKGPTGVGLCPGHRGGSLDEEEGDLENLGKCSLGLELIWRSRRGGRGQADGPPGYVPLGGLLALSEPICSADEMEEKYMPHQNLATVSRLQFCPISPLIWLSPGPWSGVFLPLFLPPPLGIGCC